MHRDLQKSTIDSWFRSPWNDWSKIPINTHVCFTDETTVQNSQKSVWLFLVRFYRPEICRRARGRFSFVSNGLKFTEKRVVIFWSFHRWNFCTKWPAVVFWSFRLSSGLPGLAEIIDWWLYQTSWNRVLVFLLVQRSQRQFPGPTGLLPEKRFNSNNNAIGRRGWIAPAINHGDDNLHIGSPKKIYLKTQP